MKTHHGVASLSAATSITALIAACVAGCGGGTPPSSAGGGGTFTLAVSDDPQNLDPHGPLGRYRANLQLGRLLYDPLVNTAIDGRIAPGLAQRWQVTGTKITFSLRPNVTCSDGAKLTASTVAGNFTYVLDPKNASSARGTAVPVGVKVSADDATGQVSIESPVPPNFLLRQLSAFSIVCQNGLTDRKILARGAAGTGPYTIAKVASGTEYRLTRRSGYAWGPGGDPAGTPPQSIVIRVVENETTAANLLVSGGVDAASVRGPDQARLQAARLTTRTFREPIGQLWWNQRKGHLTVDEKLRGALVRAIDLGEISGVATQHKGVPSQGMLQEPLVCGGVPPASALPKLDQAAAESLLTEAGWKRGGGGGDGGKRWTKDGKPLSLTFVYPVSLGPPVKSAVEVLAQRWKDFGVDVTVKALAAPAFSSTLQQTGNWDVVWSVTYPLVPTHLLGYVSGPEPPNGKNFAGIRDENYRRLSTATSASGDNCPAWNAAERSLYTTTSIVPLDDVKVPIFAKGATFSVNGTGGQIIPTTLRMG
jgi:peptide/nickel transport system substrate-binding protein